MGRTSPCKDCADRYLGCHSKCESYQEFYKKNQEEYKKRERESDLNSILGGIEVTRSIRIEKCIRNRKRRS